MNVWTIPCLALFREWVVICVQCFSINVVCQKKTIQIFSAVCILLFFFLLLVSNEKLSHVCTKIWFHLIGKKNTITISVCLLFMTWFSIALFQFRIESVFWRNLRASCFVLVVLFFFFFLFSIGFCVVEKGKTYANRLFEQIKGQKQCKNTTITQWTNESLSSISCVCLMIVCAPAHIKFSMNLQSKDGKKSDAGETTQKKSYVVRKL